MARPLRIEFENAFYHVMSRGNRRANIFEDDRDHVRFLEILESVCNRFAWRVWARCEMSNHFHILVQTLEPTLSRGMRQLKGVFTQWSNARHRSVGHLFQGRFKAILVDKDAYLTELIRYIVRNPVSARMVKSVDDYPWSSHQAVVSRKQPPDWFAKEDVLALFSSNRRRAVEVYRAFVNKQAFNYDEHLRQQIYLGDQAFVERMLGYAESPEADREVPKAHRRRASSVAELDHGQDRNDLIRAA